jgi:hypothetical protein
MGWKDLYIMLVVEIGNGKSRVPESTENHGIVGNLSEIRIEYFKNKL